MFVLEKTHPIKICVSSERERRGEERRERPAHPSPSTSSFVGHAHSYILFEKKT